jgi:hypothetical protein
VPASRQCLWLARRIIAASMIRAIILPEVSSHSKLRLNVHRESALHLGSAFTMTTRWQLRYRCTVGHVFWGPAARSGKMGFPRRATAICAHFSSTARWPLCSSRRSARKGIPGSRSCSGACRPSRRRSRSPTRPRGSPGPSWSTAASGRPAIAPPNIEPRRASLDNRAWRWVIAAAAAHHCNVRARGTRPKASRLRRC